MPKIYAGYVWAASYFQSYFNPQSEHSHRNHPDRVARQSTNAQKVQLNRKPYKDDEDDEEDYFNFGFDVDDDSSEEDDDRNKRKRPQQQQTQQHSHRPGKPPPDPKNTNGRLLSPSAIDKISETLGALNTVGHYIVDITRGQDSSKPSDSFESSGTQTGSVPDAILTLTKNVLGQNVTKTIEPLIKRRIGTNNYDDHLRSTTESADDIDSKKKKKKLKNKNKPTQLQLIPNGSTAISATTSIPLVNSQPGAPAQYRPISNEQTSVDNNKENDNHCSTPDGGPGKCEDLSSCPGLLLDLANLKDSLCFKSLFVPGVCCPVSSLQNTILTTQRPLILTTRPTVVRPPIIRTTTKPGQNLILSPQLPTSTTIRPAFAGSISEQVSNLLGVNTIDPDDCGQQEYSSGRIVGGMEAPNGQWPWMAAIFLHGPKRTEFWCGGSLIGVKYVLTAAHCTRDSRQKPFAARQFTVRLGDVDLSTDAEPSAPVTFAVTEVRAHERFSRVGFYNDIAILVLDRPVRKSKYVIPVCLPRPGFTPHRDRLPGRRATVVGWGTTYYGGKESTAQRQADLPIWRNEDCDRAYFQPINENFLCAGYSEGGVDACQGDSGGPLMMRVDTRWIQLGIVSFGNKCGEPGYPGVYTRVSQYLDWIREHTRD
ncbi:proclotting enzyme [Condylostylus longicornis]|uniref:proclotting enzyme n=1 Tax=Condylostylus longicornis TaxID=2530218 RepID=UPI00244DCA47|nr:proclotting enzyme [Condylostylus longicornis]